MDFLTFPCDKKLLPSAQIWYYFKNTPLQPMSKALQLIYGWRNNNQQVMFQITDL